MSLRSTLPVGSSSVNKRILQWFASGLSVPGSISLMAKIDISSWIIPSILAQLGYISWKWLPNDQK
jgi:hypothetical protein